MDTPQTTPDEQEAPKVPYTIVDKSDEPGAVKRYRVTLEREQFNAKIDDILEELRKTVVIDGFRRGKAPARLLMNRFGKDAEQDALKELAQDVAAEIVAAESLIPISEPELHESKAEADQPVELTIDIDIRPVIEIKDYTGMEVEVECQSVTDATVDEQLEMIRNANATYETPEKPKAFEKGDGMTVDLAVADAEGKPIENRCQENILLREPQASLPGEIADELIGKKAGDVIEKTITETRQVKSGKEVTRTENWKVTVKEVKTKVVPELDDEFAKDLGDFENLAALRKRILDDLTQQEERTKRTRAMDQLFDKIIAANPFDAPRKIVAAQEYQTIMRDTARLRQMGLDISAMGQTPEAYLESARSNSERLVKMNLLIAALADKENLEVEDADIDKEIERQAEESGRKPLAIRARLEAEKRLDSLKEELLIQKVEDFLMEKNSVKVVEPKPAKDDAK